MSTTGHCIQNYFLTNVLRDFGQRKYIHINSPTSQSSSSGGNQTRPTSQSSSSGGNQTPPTSQQIDSSPASPAGSSPLNSSGRIVAGTNRPTALTKWVQSHQKNNQPGTMKSLNKQWVHPPDSLVKGHIVYQVKFLGETEVEQPKGTDVVRDAIRKMKFSRHIRKAEGQKSPKVELTISADGVTIQEPKNKVVLHQYPLHRISYCADDKADKRMFTFIAKEADTTKHFCYVFDSDKCAEEITLTVGQAFDLAYRRFLETSGKDMDQKKQHLILQKKVQSLQQENDELKRRITEISKLKDKTELEEYRRTNNITSLTSPSNALQTTNKLPQSPVSPANVTTSKPAVGRRLEHLIFDDNFGQQKPSNGLHHQNTVPAPIISPPPPSVKTRSQSASSLQSPPSNPVSTNPFHTPQTTAPGAVGFEAAPTYTDPFGMGAFTPTKNQQELDVAIQNVDNELMDLRSGFSRGISFGTDDFSLEDLDPLNQK